MFPEGFLWVPSFGIISDKFFCFVLEIRIICAYASESKELSIWALSFTQCMVG